MSEHPAADLVRLAALLLVPVIEGALLVVLTYYAKRYRAAVRGGMVGRRANDASSWVGLLPQHVVAITLGTGLLVLSMAAEMVASLGTPINPLGAPVALAAFGLLIFALVQLARYEHRMYRPA